MADSFEVLRFGMTIIVSFELLRCCCNDCGYVCTVSSCAASIKAEVADSLV